MAPPVVVGTRVSEGAACRHSRSAATMIRSMVATASTGYWPTPVSADSITASAPSSTALATSETSALVGLGAEIMDSSICVATMTGLALSLARVMARFCTIGTCSSGSSTPRSPRATISPSKASSTSGSAATACGFSIFAMSGSLAPISSMIARTGAASSGPCTKDNATMSARSSSAQRRSFRPLHEGQRDHVGSQLKRPAQVLLVLDAERGHVEPGARHVEALVVGHRTADEDPGPHPLAPDGHDLEHHPAVVHEYLITRPDVGAQARVGGRRLRVVPGNVLTGDGELTARYQLDRARGKGAKADLGPLQIDQDADSASGRLRGGPHRLVRRQVVSLGAVAHVEPGHVQAGRDELGDLRPAAGGGPDGADDLRPTTHDRCLPAGRSQQRYRPMLALAVPLCDRHHQELTECPSASAAAARLHGIVTVTRHPHIMRMLRS